MVHGEIVNGEGRSSGGLLGWIFRVAGEGESLERMLMDEWATGVKAYLEQCANG